MILSQWISGAAAVLVLTAMAVVPAFSCAHAQNASASTAPVAVVGKPAPDFSGVDVISGKPFKLSDTAGKITVLEWTNNECPFVHKHYDTGNMQAVQKAAREKGVEWISIVSSADGKQGHVTAAQAKTITEEVGATISAKILDEKGVIGQQYGAQTTPHMFVIDAKGVLAYAGAIDDQPTPRHETVEGAKNYVLAAIDDLLAERKVAIAETKPYGCGVKY